MCVTALKIRREQQEAARAKAGDAWTDNGLVFTTRYVAMRILRHSKIAVTMEIYTEAPSEAARGALRELGELFG